MKDGGGLRFVVTGAGTGNWIFRYSRDRRHREMGSAHASPYRSPTPARTRLGIGSPSHAASARAASAAARRRSTARRGHVRASGHVLRLVEPMWTTKPETAERVRQRIEAVIDEFVKTASVVGIRRNVDKMDRLGHRTEKMETIHTNSKPRPFRRRVFIGFSNPNPE
jgi:hypothetical protein